MSELREFSQSDCNRQILAELNTISGQLTQISATLSALKEEDLPNMRDGTVAGVCDHMVCDDPDKVRRQRKKLDEVLEQLPATFSKLVDDIHETTQKLLQDKFQEQFQSTRADYAHDLVTISNAVRDAAVSSAKEHIDQLMSRLEQITAAPTGSLH